MERKTICKTKTKSAGSNILHNYPVDDQQNSKPQLLELKDKVNFEHAWQWAVN